MKKERAEESSIVLSSQKWGLGLVHSNFRRLKKDRYIQLNIMRSRPRSIARITEDVSEP